MAKGREDSEYLAINQEFDRYLPLYFFSHQFIYPHSNLLK